MLPARRVLSSFFLPGKYDGAFTAKQQPWRWNSYRILDIINFVSFFCCTPKLRSSTRHKKLGMGRYYNYYRLGIYVHTSSAPITNIFLAPLLCEYSVDEVHTSRGLRETCGLSREPQTANTPDHQIKRLFPNTCCYLHTSHENFHLYSHSSDQKHKDTAMDSLDDDDSHDRGHNLFGSGRTVLLHSAKKSAES